VERSKLRVEDQKFLKRLEDFPKLHFEQVLLPISSANGAFVCFMHLVVHTYDYIHLVRLPMTRKHNSL